MDLRILDTNFQTIKVLDAYDSLVWRESYYKAGSFELFTEVNPSVLEFAQKENYIVMKDTDRVMIIEDIAIDTDIDTGNFFKITGRSLESIIDRRIVWGLKTYNGNLQNGIKALLNESIIAPSDSNRKISNFIFKETNDPTVTSLTIDTQWTGDNIYDIVSGLCYVYDIGYKITLNNSNQFVFELYAGADRTYDQDKNPYVIFSPTFENLVNSNYYESNSNLKNITLIGGQGEGKDRIYTTYGSGSGLSRRELFTDARDLAPKDPETEKDLTESQYKTLLQNRGKAKLDEHIEIVAFEGEVESQKSFVYNKDFFLGDVVQLENEYGFIGETRILEVVTSMDQTGYSVYPTFSII